MGVFMTNFDISGKTAIVTGGGTGIGRGISLALAEVEVNVVLTGRRQGPLDEVSKAIEKAGGKCLVIVADVTIEEDVRQLVEGTVQAFGAVDIVVSNAGIGGSGFIHDLPVETWDRVMATNLRGPFLLARHTLPLMRAQRHGHLIHISSESGLEYYPGNGAYGVSKHALNDLGEYIQRENQDYGIRVDTICPGMVVTPMSKGSPGLNEDKCLYPEDIADLVIWLLSRRPNVKIGRPILIQTMENPWQ
jgi:NAD(P)-dependent dehydrogenase (short-subunit alcohol dehydrogenase family)